MAVEWTYRRVASDWRSLIPGRAGRRRETVTGSSTVELDGSPWIEACRATWSNYPAPINLMEGRPLDYVAD